MPTKDERKVEAQKHIALVKGVFAAETAKAVQSAVLYEDGEGRDLELPEPRFDGTDIRVERTDAAEALVRAKGKACVLDFASYRFPGGGYLNGAWAQEEALCSVSNLQPILEGLSGVYYEPNRQSMRGGLYTDRALYLTDVVFTVDGRMKKRDVIVCAAVNRRFALENHRSEAECDIDMRHRVHAVMGIAAANQVDTLVLGAFGCGVFGNDPALVATAFCDWLAAHPGLFERVVFAIPGGVNLAAFQEAFGIEAEGEKAKPKQVVSDDQDEDEDEAWRNDLEENNGRWVFD